MSMNKKNILLVEDDPNFGSILKEYLKINGYQVTLAKNGIEGFEKFKKEKFSLCLLDVMMPYKDGFTLAKEIREIDDLVPLIFLTAKTLKEDVLKGFKLGADDYLTKPFDSEVLLAKIKSILGRRMIKEVADTVFCEREKTNKKIGNFSLNTKLRLLNYLDQKPIKLSPKENQLLRLLAIHINDLLPRDQALSKIWRDDNYFTSRSMDVYIAKLRKYLKKDDRVEILNIHGKGFQMVVNQ